MKKILLVLVLAIGAYQLAQHHDALPSRSAASESSEQASDAVVTQKIGDDALAVAYRDRQSNVQVFGTGVVSKVLSDDNDGSRHQRFIVRLPSGQTILIAHNIDIAPRVGQLSEGEAIEFSGEYEWNNKGGVVHWTHRDPSGRHTSGYIKYRGRTYR